MKKEKGESRVKPTERSFWCVSRSVRGWADHTHTKACSHTQLGTSVASHANLQMTSEDLIRWIFGVNPVKLKSAQMAKWLNLCDSLNFNPNYGSAPTVIVSGETKQDFYSITSLCSSIGHT